MKLSIKNKIYYSFFFLVLLFVGNGIFTITTLNSNKSLSDNIADVIEPALEHTGNLEDLVIQSKMYTTSWVFLRSHQDDKDALQQLQDTAYPKLKSELNLLYSKLNDKHMVESLNRFYVDFEKLIGIEKQIMALLQKFEDYADPVKKLEAERIVEDEFLPRVTTLTDSLDVGISYMEDMITEKNNVLLQSSINLRTQIFVLVITIICAGIFLSFYMAKIIITPIHKIRHIVNDLGKGIINQLNYRSSSDEIGDMVRSVNNLSEKLQSTALFAYEVGNRNFNVSFEPLSDEDTLGKALIAMRDNIQSSDQKLNEAQHIAHLGNWERDITTDQVYLSDEMFVIFDIDPVSFDGRFQNILELIHPEDIEYFLSIVKKYMNDQQPVAYECRIITERDAIKHIFIKSQVVVNADKEIVKTIGIVQDITSRKKAEEALHKSEANLRTIFNNTDVSYVLLDANLNILSFNHHANNRFEIESFGILLEGKNFIDCLPQERKSISIERCAKVLLGEYINFETNHIKSNGLVSWNYMRMFPVSDNENRIHGMVMALSDITEQKQSEIQREKITADLLQRNNDLEQFTYIVSHNLRSPVANIIGLSEMLTDIDLDNETKADIITGLTVSSEKLDGVIMDLNHVLQVKHGISENKIPICMPGLVKDILTSISGMVEKEKAEINFDFTEADEITTTKSYLYSIFYNLITNSIKYRQPLISPVLEIKSCKLGNKLTIIFSDNGLGIDLLKKREQVFGLYKRFHPHIEGKGMGLFMVKTQVELLGGKINIESEINKGTTFKIEFDI
ncbi:hypothetical protein BH11BAC6_BH11BAC6_09490 [soil metagenome]